MSDRTATERKFRARLDQIKAEIDKIEAGARSAKASAEISSAEALSDLKTRRDKLEKDMKDLGSASGDAWEDIKAGVQTALEDMGNAVDRAASRFK